MERAMSWTILSERAARPDVGWEPLYEFEDILRDLTGGQLVTFHRRTGWSRRFGGWLGHYQPVNVPRTQGDGPHVLLLTAMTPYSLRALQAIPDWRRRFDKVAAYVIDSYYLEQYPQVTEQLDHLFVPIGSTIEPLRSKWKCPVSLLPMAANALGEGSHDDSRPIDVLAFGRTRWDLHQRLQTTFHHRESSRWYVHSPFGHSSGEEVRRERRMFWQILRRAKLSLAYDTLAAWSGHRRIPVAILTPRWYESLCAGCVLVGAPSTAPEAAEALDWEDAIIPLPDALDDAVAAIEQLLADEPRVEAARRRNCRQAWARHDWRHRIADLLNVLQLPHPAELTQALRRLRALADGVAADAPVSFGMLAD
jgi:hypothetical protein